MVNLQAYSGFPESAIAVLTLLHDRLGFGLWMVSRQEGNDWIVLQAEDHGYGIKPGDLFRWADSFCSQMVQGRGPQIAPQSDQVAAYRTAPINQLINIGAYIGLPLVYENGDLFGTLCAIDPSPQPDTIAQELPLLELLARLLSSVLQGELALEQEIRHRERIQLEAETDALTGLYNRRGWERILALEEQRCLSYAPPASIIALDLDELKPINDTMGHSAGDKLLQRTAQILTQISRRGDCVARLGGDEFALLLVNCDAGDAIAFKERLTIALAQAGIQASIGHGNRHPAFGLSGALQAADRAMYADKARHRESRSPGHQKPFPPHHRQRLQFPSPPHGQQYLFPVPLPTPRLLTPGHPSL